MGKMDMMGKIVRFPMKKHANGLQSPTTHPSTATHGTDPSGRISWIFSKEDDDAFFQLLREWPCFQDCPDPELSSLFDLFESYHDNKLTPSQDCALEFMLHIHNPEVGFDIGHALYSWNEQDRDWFMLHLTMHAELIQSIKEEEEQAE